MVGGIEQYLAPCPKLVTPMDTSGQSPLLLLSTPTLIHLFINKHSVSTYSELKASDMV